MAVSGARGANPGYSSILAQFPATADSHGGVTDCMRSPAPVIHEPSAARFWSAFAALAVLLLIPLLVTEIPPLLDYPNHLARMEILAHRGDDPVLARMYRIEWRIVPNIGIDLAMPALMRLLPIYVAGKVFVALALVLPLTGVVLLHRALFRARSYWPLAAGLVVYNRLFFAGFLNFLIGVGLALVAAAVWEFLRERPWPRIAVGIVAGVAIFFCHLIAVAFYGLLLLALEVAPQGRARRLTPGRLAMVAVPFVIPAILYLNAPIGAVSPEGHHGLVALAHRYYWALAASWQGLKLYGFLGPFLTYSRLLDVGALALVGLVLAGLRIGGHLRIAPALAGAAAALMALYLVTPFFMMETAWVDQRMPIMAGFLLFAGTEPKAPSARTRRLITTAFGSAILARTAVIGLSWMAHDVDLADFRSVIAPVQPGERVLVVQPERNADPGAMVNNPDSVRAMIHNDSTMHLPGLLVIEHQAFWPLLFTAPTKQPVRVNPPYDAISLPEGELPWVGGLAAPGPEDLRWAPYLADWQSKFDWVLLLHPGWVADGYDLLPDRLDKERSGRIAVLYRVRR